MSRPDPPHPEEQPDDFATRSMSLDGAPSDSAHQSASHTRSTMGGRFAPGVVLSDRYRIVSFLGKGGMGEVYRAEDLRLGQQVALKFLPPEASRSPAARDRLHAEVRLARQVAHRHVCRVYDIGEARLSYGPSDSTALELSFLTMEYVDGEDLATLTRRIGRLPHDKALQIARQVCAGLAAAHDAGIIHRDLKPANIMLDGRGEARLTDFGIAGLAEELAGAGKAGTPLYMAPEQHAGAPASVRTDVYSLGLVLYELFTGKRAIGAKDEGTISDLKSREAIEAPSSLVRDIDPAVERVILRCLSRDPALRPASALAVAAALPGGDPLAAALAAGETPSPSMVAASGNSEAMRPMSAVALALATLSLLAAFVYANAHTKRWGLVPTPKPPAVLEERAREALTVAGWPERSPHEARTFQHDREAVYWLLREDLTSQRRLDWQRRSSPATIQFGLRGAVRPFRTVWFTFFAAPVSIYNPPVFFPGDWRVLLDTEGRLIWLERVPAWRESHEREYPPAPEAARFHDLFQLAGLDIARFERVEPTLRLPHEADEHAEWIGSHPNEADVPIRVAARALGGRVTYFELFYPWTTAPGDEYVTTAPTQRLMNTIGQWVWSVLLIVMVSAVVLYSVRNLRSRRADVRGAAIVAGFVFVVGMLGFGLNMYGGLLSRLADPLTLIPSALFPATLIAFSYIAVEPTVRRTWPQSLVSWTRLLSGRLIDPVVGRAVLLGLFGGALASIVRQAANLAAIGVRGMAFDSDAADLSYWLGMRKALSFIFDNFAFTLSLAFVNLLVLVGLRRLLGGRMPLILACYVVFWLFIVESSPLAQIPWLGWAPIVFAAIVFYWLVVRHGVLAAAMFFVVYEASKVAPLLPDLDAWHGETTMLWGVVTCALVAWGFAGAVKGASWPTPDAPSRA